MFSPSLRPTEPQYLMSYGRMLVVCLIVCPYCPKQQHVPKPILTRHLDLYAINDILQLLWYTRKNSRLQWAPYLFSNVAVKTRGLKPMV